MQKPLFRPTNIFRFLGAALILLSAFFATPQLTMLGIFGQALPVAGILLFAGPLLIEMIRGNGTEPGTDDFLSFFRFSNLLRLIGFVLLVLSILVTTPVVDIRGIGGEVLPLSGVLILCGPTLAELYRAVKDRVAFRSKPQPPNEGGIP